MQETESASKERRWCEERARRAPSDATAAPAGKQTIAFQQDDVTVG